MSQIGPVANRFSTRSRFAANHSSKQSLTKMTQKFMTFQIADLERQSPKDFIKSRLDLQDELLHELKLLKQDLNSKLELEINQEYTSFISLPQNLIGSDEIIADFQVKLRGALDALDEISKEYQGDSKLIKDLIEKRQEIRKEKQKLKIQVQISERLSKVAKLPSPSISSINQFEDYCKKLDRYSIEFNQLQFLSSQVGGAGGHEKLEILEMKTNLTKSIQSCLKICFEELLQTNGLTVSKKEVEEKPERLVRNEQATLVLNFCCETLVRISSTLGTLNPTMEIFKQVIIDPFLVKLGLYQEHELFPAIRGFLESNCSIIDTVANSRQSFVVEGWQVIGQYLLDNQPMIFHVSSPQRFHDLFQASQKVLDFVMSTSDLSIQLKSGNVYRDYCKRWQLSVYFQLINNQHVSNFEQTLAAEVVFEKSENQDLMTKPSKLLVKILQHVWGPTVFIRQLGHRFMKMTIVVTIIVDF